MAVPEDALETVNDSVPHTDDEMETQVNTVAAEPRLFGRYRLIRELGRGGGGVVWLAHDEVLNISVALKLIPDSVIHDTEGIIDLKKEVLRGMALTHPGIVRVFSFEQDSTSAAIVMEYVDGETLADYKLRQNGRCFDCDEVRPWLDQLCAALDYAHTEACIAHRDLKPRNIMMASSGKVKVADFGIASSLTDSLSRVSVRIDSSGTPPYMSPQQAMGERPSHLDDIYSLGATIYELLTSKPPFFRGDILAQVLHEAPPSMAERRAELGITAKASIPEVWEKLIAACLAKQPAGRPANGAAVIEFFNAKTSGALAVAAPVLAIREPLLPVSSQSDTSNVTISPAPVRHACPAAWAAKPESFRSEPIRWLRTLVTVIIAAALAAGVLTGVRKWASSKAETASLSHSASPPANVTQSLPVSAPVNSVGTATATPSTSTPKQPVPPVSRLTTGTLDQPPEGPLPRRGPRRGPPPPPPGHP